MIGYDDPDLPDGLPFVLKVPNNDKKISARIFLEFYNRVLEIPDLNILIRKFSEENLDVKVKMRKLLAFFREVLKK
jgi:hypothetical protein